MRPNGLARESRCGAPARSVGVDGACRRIRSCRPLAGSATGLAPDPAPKNSSRQHHTRQQGPGRSPSMSVAHHQPRRSRPAGPRPRSLSALQMARSSSAIGRTDCSKDELARMRGRPSHVRHPVQKRATSSTTIRAAASVKLLDNGSRTARMRVMERSFREFHKGFVV